MTSKNISISYGNDKMEFEKPTTAIFYSHSSSVVATMQIFYKKMNDVSHFNIFVHRNVERFVFIAVNRSTAIQKCNSITIFVIFFSKTLQKVVDFSKRLDWPKIIHLYHR